MIVGRGDIAVAVMRSMVDTEDKTFFASGVSNSQETRNEEYDREVNLLLSQNQRGHIVYFSSLSVFYADTQYSQHKRMMEKVVKQVFDTYTIIRLGNITWGDNPNTFINYFKKQIQETGDYVLSKDRANEYRYIIDIDEFIHWLHLIPTWSCEMDITGTRMTVQEAIEKYGKS